MTNKIKVKLILELRDTHMSQNSIAKTRNMSKSSVSEVCKIADERKISLTYKFPCASWCHILAE